MLKRKENFFSKIIFNQITFAVILVIIIILISFPLAKNVSKRYKITKEIKELEREINELKKQNTGLKEFIDYLNSEQYAESKARIDLGLKKEGEEVVVVKTEANEVLEKKEIINGGRGSEAQEKIAGNAIKWRDYFFKPRVVN